MGFLDQIKTSSKTPSNGLKSSTSSSGGFLDKIVTTPQNSQPEATEPTKIPLGQGISLSGPLGGMAKSTQAVPTATTPNITPVSVAKPILQGTARAVGTVGITAGNLPYQLAGQKNPFQETIPTDQSKITRAVFGGEPIKTVQQRIEDTRKALEPIVGKNTAGLFSATPVVASIALDLTGWGGGKAVKNFVPGEVPETFFKYLGKEKNAIAIEKTLLDVGMTAEYAKPLSIQFAKTKTAQEAKDVLSVFDEILKKPKLGTVEMNIDPDIRDLRISPEQKNALQALREGASTPELLSVVKTIDPKVFEAPAPAVKGGFLDQVQKSTPVTPGNVPETKIPVKVTGDSVAQDLKKMGSDRGVSDFLLDTVKKEDYVTEKISIQSLLDSDPALKDYIDTTKGKIRRYTPNENQIPPIVTSEGEVWDGYNRISQAIKNGETEIEVFKGIPKATPKAPVYEGETDLTTKILKDLEGKTTVSKQYISDATNRGELKQAERDIIRQALESEGDTVNVKEFAEKVKNELLPLNVKSSDLVKTNTKDPYADFIEEGSFTPKYEQVALPSELRGKVSNYKENIYESPISTSAGNTHFQYNTKKYFGHTRVEDMADDATRRVIEVQSDLYQKGNLEREISEEAIDKVGVKAYDKSNGDLKDAIKAENEARQNRRVEVSKLQQYNDPSAHFRMVREEIKKAAQDGKTKLQFPTGETAMKIEGLGELSRFNIPGTSQRVTPENLKVGMEVSNRPIQQQAGNDVFVVTKVLDGGKFVAVPKVFYDKIHAVDTSKFSPAFKEEYIRTNQDRINQRSETFDISGKVDTSNPIYKFYEKEMQKYLSKFGAQKVTDSKGVTWYEIPISKSQSGAVEAFSKRRPLLNKDIYMSKDEIREILFKDIPKNDLTLIFTKELIQGVADGSFVVHPTLGNLIRLFEEGGKVSLLTALHEQKHYFFSKLSPEIQKEALAIAKKEMGPLYKNKLESLYKDEYNDSPNKIDMLLEEYVVDKWSKSDASKGFGYKQSVYGKIFAALDNLLKRMVTTYNKVKARADAFFKERGGSKGGYINFGEEKPKKTPFGKSVGKVTIGGKEIDITKGGQMDIPVPAKVSEIEKDLIEKKIQLELKQELLENSPFKSKENRLMVDREGPIRELGDIKSKKLIRKVEDRMAESGVSDPAEFSAGVEKYFQDKQDIAKLKRDIVALESTGNFAEGQRKQVKDIVKDSKLLLQESGAPIKTSAEGLPIALSKRQKEIVANSPFKDVSPVRIPVVEGTYAEIKAIEKLASQAESYIHGTPLPQGMTFAEVLEKTVTPIENKIGWFDILVRTPDRVMEGIGLGQEAKDLRTAMDGYWKELPKNLEKISDWLNELGTKEASTRVFKYLDGQAVDLNPLEQKVANEIRSWLATWPDRLGLKQDQRITDYITRIFDNDKPQEFDEELAKIIQDKIPGSVYNPFTLKRLGARGYKEDLGLALDAYVKRSTRKAYMDPVLERIQSKTGSEAALSKLEESQFTYVQDYINNINMRPTKGDKRADNTIKKFFKFFGGEKGLKMVGQRPIATVSRGLRRTASRSMLGLNLGTALRNLSQGVNTYAVLGEKYTTIGYVNLFKQGAFDELKEEGVLNAGFIQDKILSSTAKFWEKTDKVLYSLIEVGELINRGSAYFGAKAKYISENRKIMDGVEVWKEGSSMRDAIDYAKGIVRKTQFSFDSVDTPVGLQGDFVKTVIQFLGYPIKQAEFLFELAKDKNYAGILRYILGGVLFTYTIGQLFDMKLKNLVPTVDLGWPPSIKIFTSLFDTITNAPDKFGNKNPLGKRLQNLGSTAFKTVVPGGTQINKTYQGLKAVKAGGSVDSAGRTQFKVGGTTLSNIRAAAFGKYAGKNAQDYFDKITPSERAYKNLLKYDDKKDFLTKLAKNDPDVAKGVIDILKKKAQGITEEDEKIKNMGVKNGQRAEAINKKLKKLKNNKERKDLLTDYIEKGILTEDVMVQLAELK